MNDNLKLFATEAYAKNVESHPYHRLYNQPALLSLLPPLKGLRILDAGCGTGYFTEHFVEQGAQVTALDITPQMVERTKARVTKATVLESDLAQPLACETGYFDGVFCSLSLQYLESWNLSFREFQRILKVDAWLLFSVHHPFEEFQLSGKTYFDVEVRKRKGGQLSFRRPLSSMTESLYQTGFIIERILEPLPETAYAKVDPEGYEGLLRFPALLVIRARKI